MTHGHRPRRSPSVIGQVQDVGVYPLAAVNPSSDLPRRAEFWTPKPEDIDEYEGFGFFENVWAIIGVSEEEAREVLRRDIELCRLASNLANDESEFDIIASTIETGVLDDPNELTPSKRAALQPYLTEMSAFAGLEIGVAGLVHALSSVGMYPAASCRGHPGLDAWSPCPVVFVAVDRRRAEILQPLADQTECGFEIDSDRPELLAVVSRSVEGTLALATRVMDDLEAFRTD